MKMFIKGRRLYPFCHFAKHQSDVLGGWVGKNIFIMAFCVKSGSKENPISKEKLL